MLLFTIYFEWKERPGQAPGSFGGDAVPRLDVGVVDTFIGVGIGMQNVFSNVVTVPTIFILGLGNGLLGAVPEQVHNTRILHGVTSLSW